MTTDGNWVNARSCLIRHHANYSLAPTDKTWYSTPRNSCTTRQKPRMYMRGYEVMKQFFNSPTPWEKHDENP